MKTVFQAYFGQIFEVQIERETPSFYIISGGTKEKKQTYWYAYFDTFAEAKAYLVLRSLAEIELTEKHLAAEREKLAKVEALTPNDVRKYK